jgi:hypothetical protein
MTKEKKHEYNQRFLAKKRKEGWRIYSFCLPRFIGEELLKLKRVRMDEHRTLKRTEVE